MVGFHENVNAKKFDAKQVSLARVTKHVYRAKYLAGRSVASFFNNAHAEDILSLCIACS